MSELALIFWIRRFGDGNLEDKRLSPIAGQHAADPPSILKNKRIIEAKRLPQSRQGLRIALRAHDHGGDIARKNGSC